MQRMRCDYVADGLGVTSKNLSFLKEPAFAAAWAKAAQLAQDGYRGAVPNIQWRAHVACWSAAHALHIEGDFVECGVHTGLLAITICEFLRFAEVAKTFWLFDTWSGIPTDRLTKESDRKLAERLNPYNYGRDVFDIAQRNFAPYPNVRLVRGILPDSLLQTDIKKISYISIDLNNTEAEQAVIQRLWPKISIGGIILSDDYAFRGFEEQHRMWDAFARAADRSILTLPTGQGLIIK
jgi:hypothetical protein